MIVVIVENVNSVRRDKKPLICFKVCYKPFALYAITRFEVLRIVPVLGFSGWNDCFVYRKTHPIFCQK